jgi:hypothetical protein
VVGSGKVKISVNQTYPLAEAARAHRDLEARLTTGSTVLLPTTPTEFQRRGADLSHFRKIILG